MEEGCSLMMRFLREAGFEQVTKVPSDGQPGVFATLDAGAPRTIGIYFMYDVKQVDPTEWSSPPWEARLVDKPGLGKIVVGRGTVNQKGPQATFLAALQAFRGTGRKLPVEPECSWPKARRRSGRRISRRLCSGPKSWRPSPNARVFTCPCLSRGAMARSPSH